MLSENKNLTKGDLLLEKSGGGELFPVGRVVRFNLDLGKTTCSNFIQKLSPSQKYCSSFLCYLFSSMYTKKVNGLFYNQTTGIQNLKIKEYLNQTVFLPPLDEQTAIANYLDTATAKIDAAIAQQQKMIDLLNERKQIIINRAVTRGLNPNARMKDSGVEWIGEVPEHWEVSRLRNYVSIFSEKGFPNATLLSVTREHGVILRSFDKDENHNYIPDDLCNYKRVLSGDFVINKMKAWQGSCGVSEYDGIVSPAYFTFKLRGIYKPYFSLAIRSKLYTHFFMQYSKGIRTDQWDLESDAIKNIPIVVPTRKEQVMIVERVSALISQIEKGVSKSEEMISLLQERKQIIINEVVTGKVKVG